MDTRRALALVALLALGWLGLRSVRTGLAAGYFDPIGHYDAQDEALYAHSSTRMAAGASWATPTFLGRYGLYKPPLLMWLSAASMKILGINLHALRLPTLLAGAFTACVVWILAGKTGWLAVLLLLSSRLFFVLGSTALTDCLLTACIAGAVLCLYRDPCLQRNATLFLFSIALAAAILTKSVAGLVPAAIAAVFWLAAPHDCRPRLPRLAIATVLTATLALPWFFYQYRTHHHWFLAEHFGVEILAYGAGAPPQNTAENHLWFYARRLFLLDPFLCVMALCALPAFLFGWRRQLDRQLVLAWTVAVLAAVLGWRYRNVTYLLPLFPALAIMGSKCLPRPSYYWPIFALIFTVKLGFSATAWGIGIPKLEIPGASELSNYCGQHRGRELLIVNPNDGFYSAVIGLPKVRYVIVTSTEPPHQALDFRYLGITLTVPEFNNLAALEPQFRTRLAEWGLNSSGPIGTVILARDQSEIEALIHSHPEADVYLAPKHEFRYAGITSTQHPAPSTPAFPCRF